MRIFFYAPHGHELAAAFSLAAKAVGLSCRLRNNTAFVGPSDIERADLVVVLPDTPNTGLIASEYAKRKITVVTASLSDTAESLLARVTSPQEVDHGQGCAESVQPGHHEAVAGTDGTDQGSEPDTGHSAEGPSSLTVD